MEQTYTAETEIPNKIYQIFSTNNLDVLIMPVFGTPAPKLGTIGVNV